MPSVDVFIAGAGPAGLAAAEAVRNRGKTFVLVDSGAPQKERNHAKTSDLGTGVGGCGLFSDGKFSFRPSATRLWSLQDPAVLAESERWAMNLLGSFGLRMPPTSVTNPILDGVISDGIKHSRKKFPSYYMALESRQNLIGHLAENCNDSLNSFLRLEKINWDKKRSIFQCECSRSDRNGIINSTEQIESRSIIYAGGRLGPMLWPRIFPQGLTKFRRVELGVRLEHSPEVGPLACLPELDVKIIYPALHNKIEYRTFCSCRQGEVAAITYGRITAYSGRADGPPTGRSNFGFLLRILDEKIGNEIWSDFLAFIENDSQMAPLSLQDVLETGMTCTYSYAFGNRGWQLLLEGIRRLVDHFPDLLHPDSFVHAPAVEGVGYYPDVDNTLKMALVPLWVAGDATGLFRGNTAALVSGYYAGIMAASQVGE